MTRRIQIIESLTFSVVRCRHILLLEIVITLINGETYTVRRRLDALDGTRPWLVPIPDAVRTVN